MGNVCECLKSGKFKKLDEEKIKRKAVIIGLDGSGKTSIVKRLKTDEFQQVQSTVGLNLETIAFHQLELLVFDVSGKSRDIWSYYYDGIDLLIFVIDSTDEMRISIVKDEILKVTEQLKQKKYVILFYVNKSDAEKKLEMHQVVSQLEIDDLEAGVDFVIQGCSAVTGQGLREGLDKISGYLENIDAVRNFKYESETSTKRISNVLVNSLTTTN